MSSAELGAKGAQTQQNPCEMLMTQRLASRSQELPVDEMENEDADEIEFSDSDSDTDVEALLEKGGLKDWDPSSTAPILAAPPRPPQPETPPEAFAEETAAERGAGGEGYMPAPRLPASKPEPRAPELAWDPQKALGGLGLL
eukprot:s3341_g4.t3